MGSSGGLSQSYKQFLDDLRESGSINMFGAPAVLQQEFGLTKNQAIDIVKTWMEEFKKDD
jgi:hypothetical protein